MRAILEDIPAGDAGLAVKLRRLRGLVDLGRTDPRIRNLALRIVRSVPGRDFAGEVATVSGWIRRRVTYRRDPHQVELFQDPRLLAGWASRRSLAAAGDCDDLATLGATLFEALGHPTRFQVGGAGDGVWSHIWLQVQAPDGGWMTVDDTVRSLPVGYTTAAKFPVLKTTMASTRIRPRPRGFALGRCYGGSAGRVPAAPQLAGFSLKRIAQKITRPIERVVSRATPAPIRKVVTTIARPLQQVHGFVYSGASKVFDVQKLIGRRAAGPAANVFAPGSGAIVDRLLNPTQESLPQGQQQGQQQQGQDDDPSASRRRIGEPGGFLSLHNADGGTNWSTLAIFAAVGVGGFLLMRRR